MKNEQLYLLFRFVSAAHHSLQFPNVSSFPSPDFVHAHFGFSSSCSDSSITDVGVVRKKRSFTEIKLWIQNYINLATVETICLTNRILNILFSWASKCWMALKRILFAARLFLCGPSVSSHKLQTNNSFPHTLATINSAIPVSERDIEPHLFEIMYITWSKGYAQYYCNCIGMFTTSVQ